MCVCVCVVLLTLHMLWMVWYGFTFSFPHMRVEASTYYETKLFSMLQYALFSFPICILGQVGELRGRPLQISILLSESYLYYMLQTLYENSLTGFSYVTENGRSVYSMRSKSSHLSDSLFCCGKKKAEPFYSMRSQPCT